MIHTRQIPPLVIFCALALVLRFFSFFPSLIDHDESTYLVIANELLKGKLLYTDVTDIKPVGIFYIAAGIFRLFGPSIFMFRLFAAFTVALTAFLLYKAKQKMGHGHQAAMATGFIYIFFTSVWTFYGVSVNTELFYNLITALGLYFILPTGNNRGIVICGGIIGLGFLVKIVVLFDFTAFMVFFFILDLIGKRLSMKRLLAYTLSVCVFFLPFALVSLSFYLNGRFDDFFHINYETFSNYGQKPPITERALFILDFFGRFLPISVFFFIALFTKQKAPGLKTREKLFVAIWVAFTLISASMPGKSLGHYTIQVMLPVSFMAGNIFCRGFKKPAFLRWAFAKKTGGIILILFIIANLYSHKKDYFDRPDLPRDIAAFLKERVSEDDILFTGNSHQIIYLLLDKSPPTKYVHASLLFVEAHYTSLGIDPDAEIKKILEQKPRFVLERKKYRNPMLVEALQRDYTEIAYFPASDARVYERKGI